MLKVTSQDSVLDVLERLVAKAYGQEDSYLVLDSVSGTSFSATINVDNFYEVYIQYNVVTYGQPSYAEDTANYPEEARAAYAPYAKTMRFVAGMAGGK